MWHVLLFNGFLATGIIYALLRGGTPERIGALIELIGCAATALLYSTIDRRFHGIETGVLIVDASAMIAFLVLLLCSTRFWPGWGVAVQSAAVAVHMMRLATGAFFAFPYAMVLALLGYSLPAILIAGTWWHGRRMTLHGTDPAWRRDLRKS